MQSCHYLIDEGGDRRNAIMEKARSPQEREQNLRLSVLLSKQRNICSHLHASALRIQQYLLLFSTMNPPSSNCSFSRIIIRGPTLIPLKLTSYLITRVHTCTSNRNPYQVEFGHTKLVLRFSLFIQGQSPALTYRYINFYVPACTQCKKMAFSKVPFKVL